MAEVAYALGLWLNFLVARGVGWVQAVPEDVEAFKYWRMADADNPRRVAAGTLKGDLVTLNVFYTWASRQYGVDSPVVLREVRAPARTGRDTVEEIAAGPVGVRSRDLKWFTPAGYRRWRDVGLRGFGLDGREDPASRGRNERRDGAFADGLFEIGLRLQEWASILDLELQADDPDRGLLDVLAHRRLRQGPGGAPFLDAAAGPGRGAVVLRGSPGPRGAARTARGPV